MFIFFCIFRSGSGIRDTKRHFFATWIKYQTISLVITNFQVALQACIGQSLLQVRQLLHYCNHGDLFAVWFAVERYLWGESGQRFSECVCGSPCEGECLFANTEPRATLLDTFPTDFYSQTLGLTPELKVEFSSTLIQLYNVYQRLILNMLSGINTAAIYNYLI